MPCFIYINGYPGIGKLTIAKELQQLLPNSKVYHNHLLIDPIDALVERSSPGYHEMRTGLRRYILNEIVTSKHTKDKRGFLRMRERQAQREKWARNITKQQREREAFRSYRSCSSARLKRT
ncbi:hypothetical protein BKA60DRAFT_163286 [Fusarium oxysporum]|nr:hypothetical protein BKA60DRAFT_163286 [Fusarium oxysporum]